MLELHPSTSELHDFLIGNLPDREYGAIESHLAACDECAARGAGGRSRDSLVDLLAAAAANIQAERSAAVTPIPQDTQAVFAGTRSGDFPDESGLDVVPAGLANHSRYKLLRKLGAGGMGNVLLAEQLALGRKVAIKVIRPEFLSKPGAVERFRREARAVARLNHPNIVAAFDAEEAAGTHFLVMEYIAGENLGDELRRGALLPQDACRAVRDAARGLAHAHSCGLMHRDIKPQNLIRAADGAVKILDFGLASAEADCLEGLTGENMVLGTPDYIAPEQAQDPRAADIRSDIYALGCTLFALLSGRVPYAEGNAMTKLDAHRHGETPELQNVPPALAALVRSMMAKRPADRPTAAEVEIAVEPFCLHSIHELPASAIPSARKKLSRLGIGLGALFAIGTILAGVVGVKIQRDNQMTVVETDDPDVELVIRRNGKLVRIVDSRSNQTWELDAEKLRLKPDGSELSVDLPNRESLVLSRQGKAAVTIRRKSPAPKIEPPPPEPDQPPDQIRRFVGHTGTVRAVAYSPDGKHVLSGSGWPLSDLSVRLWEVATGKEVWAKKTPGAVTSVSFCPSKDVILFGGSAGLVQLLDVKTGDARRTFRSRNSNVVSVAASSDGRWVMAGAEDGSVQVWDLDSGAEIQTFRQHRHIVVCVAFSPLGQHAVSGSADGHVVLWDVATGKEVKAYRGTPLSHGIAITPDGKCVAFADDTTIFVWDVETGEIRRRFEMPKSGSPMISLAISSQGRHLLAGGTDKILYLWDLESGKLRRKYSGHSDMIWGVAFSPDGRRALSGSGGRLISRGTVQGGEDYSLRLWSLSDSVLSPSTSDSDLSDPPVLPSKTAAAQDPCLRVTDYREIHNAPLADLKGWLEKLPAGFRPATLTSVAGAQPPRFNAVAIQDGMNYSFDARLDLDGTGGSHRVDFNSMVNSGWALRLVCTYTDGETLARHHLWVKDGRPWVAWGRDLSGLKERFADWKKDGLRPLKYYLDDIDRGRTLPERPYGVLLGAAVAEEWQALLELTEPELKSRSEEARKLGLRPEVLDALGVGENLTFALTLVPNPSGTRWEYSTFETTSQFEASLKAQRASGLRPLTILADLRDSEISYRVLWIQFSPE